ncbi:Protein of unknown function [Gryllus bimaculatus]|nr:Protein of unknown function [Gryllus bimaculatus]
MALIERCHEVPSKVTRTGKVGIHRAHEVSAYSPVQICDICCKNKEIKNQSRIVKSAVLWQSRKIFGLLF